MRHYLFFTFLIFSLPQLKAQDNASLAMQEFYSKAKEQMVQGNYQEANVNFRKALSLKQKMPTDLCYFFAETLYQIQQFQNSENFINKYLELTGSHGKYFSEASALKKRLNDRLEAIKACSLCDSKGFRFGTCNFCSSSGQAAYQCPTCSGTGNLMCQKCMGEGILITKNSQNENRYSNCGQCKQKGYVTCPKCHGEKVLSGVCSICQGTKKTNGKTVCTHKPLTAIPEN
ncbi:MAG: hypothetical protein MI784_02015 [Cytophagales bacterium]|nr:hypothetical protein [Cytophagales bacterium]